LDTDILITQIWPVTGIAILSGEGTNNWEEKEAKTIPQHLLEGQSVTLFMGIPFLWGNS
jgi:hypothetical protein